MRKPWNVESLTVDDVKEILGNDYEKSSKEVLIATQICHLLAQNTDGNPRKIKRFVNMLLLRYEIAKNRGRACGRDETGKLITILQKMEQL